jgi:hypothetical protein
MDLKERVGHALHSSGSGQSPVVGNCKDNSEPLDCM